jgi:pyruvate ferredoxin oxidoreductase alpha subunit
MEQAKPVVLDIAAEFSHTFGRDYGLFETYKLEDAEVALVALNSTAGTIKAVVDQLRDEGLPVGLLKPRLFRPFPAQELVAALQHLKAIAVMDRAISFGSMDNGGPLFSELAAAFYVYGPWVPMVDYVYGLGGRDILTHEIESVFREVLHIAATGEIERQVTFLGVREKV